MPILRVYFIVDERKFEVPHSIISSSKVIRCMIGEYGDVVSEIVFNPYLSMESMMEMNSLTPSQYIIPVLDFLECDNLDEIGISVIDRTIELDPSIKKLIYGIPRLAYRAYILGMMLTTELPPYSSEAPSITIEDIGYDIDKLIELINLGFSARNILTSADGNRDFYTRLYRRINEVDDDRLESLAIEDPTSEEVLDRMIELRMVNNIELIYGDLIRTNARIAAIIKTKSEDMIDMLGRICQQCELCKQSILENSLRLGYLYPIRYGPGNINDGIERISSVSKLRISIDDFNGIIDLFTSNSLIKLINLAGINNRYDLIDVIIDRIPKRERPHPLNYCITADFDTVEEYKSYTGVIPTPYNINIVSTLRSNRYGGLFKKYVESSPLDYKMKILTIIISLDQQVNNLELLDYLVECISPEELSLYIRHTSTDWAIINDIRIPLLLDVVGYYMFIIASIIQERDIPYYPYTSSRYCRSRDIITKYNNAIVEYAELSLL